MRLIWYVWMIVLFFSDEIVGILMVVCVLILELCISDWIESGFWYFVFIVMK